MIASRRTGVRLDEVIQRFGVSKRTAQRMMRALEERFPQTRTARDHEGRKIWLSSGQGLGEFLSVSADELAALDLAVDSFSDAGHRAEARRLSGLRDQVLALLSQAQSARIEPDRDALLEAQGLLARPGPRPKMDREIADVLAEAIKACRLVDVNYQALGAARARKHRIAPLGILLGLRRYVIGWKPGKPARWTTVLRADNIHYAELTSEHFERPPDFDLKAYAKRSFGAFQNEAEFGEVVWRFTPEAAEQAKCFQFHPDQSMTAEADGALTVRFKASGHLEMCWFLYAWGHAVEVLAPPELRALVTDYRRSDFSALP